MCGSLWTLNLCNQMKEFVQLKSQLQFYTFRLVTEKKCLKSKVIEGKLSTFCVEC